MGFRGNYDLILGLGDGRTLRRKRRDRIADNKRRRQLWLAMSRKKEREQDACYPSYGPTHYGRDGWPISMRSWCLLIESSRSKRSRVDYRRVAGTKVLDDPEVWVSTVWLGIDHGFNFTTERNYRPVIFETMIFGGPLDQDYQERYCTEAEALEGHARAVEIAKAGKVPDEDGENHRPALDTMLEALEQLAKTQHGGSEQIAPGVRLLYPPEARDKVQEVAKAMNLSRAIDEVAKAMSLSREDVADIVGKSDDKK